MKEGYGRLWVGSKGQPGYGGRLVHRAYYEITVGTIPAGHDLHHKCSNPPCFNPAHLEVLTRKEHLDAEQEIRPRVRPTHCPYGHEYTPENIHSSPGRTTRLCKRCIDMDAAFASEVARVNRVGRVLQEATKEELVAALASRSSLTLRE